MGKIKELKISYDEEADVLYVTLGHPRYTVYKELTDDFIIRLDPQTGEIIGFTIIDFAKHFSPEKPQLLEKMVL